MQTERVNARDFDPTKIRVLEYLHAHEQAHPNESADLSDFLTKDCGLSMAAAIGLVRAMHAMGLVHDFNTMGGPAAMLDDLGRENVTKLLAHRADPRRREAAARNQLLAYLHDCKRQRLNHRDPAAAAETPFADFYGDSLSADEFRDAADYLGARGLLTILQRNIADIPLIVNITAAGEDCMNEYDGDVAEYLRDTRTRGGVHNTTHIGTMHAGNAAFVNGDHNTITQTSSSGIDPTALLDLVAGLRPMLSTFGAVEPEAKVLVDEMEAQGHTSTPNAGIVRRNVEKLIDMAVPLGLRMVAEWLRFEGQKHGVLPPA